MKHLFRVLTAASILALSACGGGGGNGGVNAPATLGVTVTPSSASTTPFSLVDVPIRVTGANGAPARDGTSVTLQVTPPGVGVVSSLTAQASQGATPVVIGERVTSTTVGGLVNFRFHSRAVGIATLIASATDTASATATATSQNAITVVAGAPRDPRLTLTTNATTLPANRLGVQPFLGSPYLSEVAITWRRLNGELVTVFPTGRTNVVDVTVTPVLNTGGFSTPDDPDTQDINEFLLHLATAPVETNGGRAVVFLQSIDQPGTTTVQVAARDPDTDETVQAELSFTITNGSPRLPATVRSSRDRKPVYINGSGGNTAERFELRVEDGGGGLVADPVSGPFSFNNIQAEIVGNGQGGETLSGVSASGATQRASLIRFRTFSGLGNFVFQSGTRVGTVPLRITVDRADNNVDNGIQDGLVVNDSVTVGDGRLFDLDITSPAAAILLNPVSNQILVDDEVIGNQGDPNRPDGTYSLMVSAIATDRMGNPVVPGTEIRFGSIDYPQTDGFFSITGSDGNPGEGTTSFIAPTGTFQTSGAGAGPGDTLLVFGEESVGNRDLESARFVASVNSQTSLTTTYRFNFNDDTGVSVNNGPVLPYVIGRAVDGNINSVVPIDLDGDGDPDDGRPQGGAAFTDLNGVARVTMNYPTSKLGKLAAIYAQGSGDLVNNSAELVSDVELYRFAGVAPLTLTVTPTEIPGNRTSPVTVCATDGNGFGLQGLFFNFDFRNMNAATGQVDGIAGPGTLTTPTGEDGCVQVDVTTGGVVTPASGDPARIVFSFGTAEGTADILAGQMFLSASPETVTGDGGRLITLLLVDSGGNPIPGVLITGSCTASNATLTITSGPGVTNSQGRTEAVASGQGFDVTSGSGSATGVCTFTVAGGSVNDTVTWGSRNICDTFSPAVPEGCPSANLIVNINGTGTVGSIPSGLTCLGPGSCLRPFAPAASIQLQLSRAPSSFTCSPPLVNFGTATTASILMPPAGQTITCDVTFP